MRKYDDLCLPEARPALRFDLQGLQYPERMNVSQILLEGALEAGWGNRVAYYFADQEITYSALHASVHRYATAMRGLGIAAGERMLVRIADTPELIYTVLAAHVIGAVAIPTYVQLRAEDLAYRLEDSGARCAFTSADLLDELAGAHAQCPEVSIVVLPEDPTGNFRSLGEFLPVGPPETSYHDSHAEDLTLILYTSGSTGRPKGACHCHRDMIAMADTYWRHCIVPRPDDVIGGPPAVPFALGYGMFVIFGLRFGSASVLQPDKSVEASLAAIERHGITIFAGVASYFVLLSAAIKAAACDISSIRRALTGGEPLSPETERVWLEATGGNVLEQFLGTSEMFHVFLASSHANETTKAATLGRAVPGFEIVVVNPETLKPLPDGAPGLMATRGPTGTVYWQNPEKQAELVREGWNVFPDLVRRDADGFFYYIARHDEMIVSSGYNISPIEVETALMRHDAVAECAAVAAPDPSGQRNAIVKAYVVLRSGYAGDDAMIKTLQDHAKAVAPPYMYPRAVAFLDALPKTMNGKVLRADLRAQASVGA